MKWTNRLGRWLSVGAVTAVVGIGTGCLTRPVGQSPPSTKVNFTSTVSQQQVDKVDLLVMIDNSASMGDKQAILAEAVPNLLVGLLTPQCVDIASGNPVGKAADPNSNKGANFGCPANSKPEFDPVTDMHIGLISSSLGSFGGDVCADAGRSNDRAHLLNLVKGGGTLPDAGSSNFLSWYPANESNSDKKRHPDPPTPPIGDLTKLQKDFQDLVVGVDQTGCGLEAQLESMYRFLVQPDPWVKVTVNNGKANLGDPKSEVDTELLQQRADFLRPDSLVAIVMLTDEDDSSADPLSIGGQGWAFMANQFPGSTVFRADGKTTTAPRGTSACKTNPGSKDCTSCGFAATCNQGDPACQKIRNDPECAKNGGYYGPAEDQLNVRFHRMKERYGIDPQYPIKRYVDGLTKTKVPDRTVEHVIRPNGVIEEYSGTAKCTNPLFAAKLPRGQGDEICNLPVSRTRGPELIFFAVVGGVPNQLLYGDINDPVGTRINPPQWSKILGKDPANFDFSDIDPHMIQSTSARQGIPAPSDTRGDNGTDPIVGRDWKTGDDDLQYACTFNLLTKRNCTAQDPSCDCAGAKNPPLCGATAGEQVKAKAYPTVREFQVVRALGEQGIIASLCPIQLTDKTKPTYGYNPAVQAIIDRLKDALTTQCLPQALSRDETKKVPCLVLAQLAEPTDKCDQNKGLANADPEIEKKFKEAQAAEQGTVKPGDTDVTKLPVCVLQQFVADDGQTCSGNNSPGWCYVTGAAAGKCPQAVLFSGGTAALPGAKFFLQCIQQFSAGEAANDPQKQQ
ncbi:MAG: hypothetical protein JST00_27525 [Deltaproteobacteria bacterium]|nr:hypothetical protein [Deltaproteobacteria bacterium]